MGNNEYCNKALRKLWRWCRLASEFRVTVTLAMRMSNPGKEEASGILETAVHGRTIAIPEQYGGSSDWDDWLEHFEDVDAVNG
ncbi:hypothetical protein D917_09521 [Trichinella nativa]|uniref:Uncharacterized protein n=1 Tax=Trichinella nativa TaxID=6335 RepID=A0A1Y3EJ01_9BILA|nr:hypothetical protein D917_09521 [Trichinella nativa]